MSLSRRNSQTPQKVKSEDEVIADYDPYIDYDGSEPENKPDAEEEVKEKSDTEYAKMELP